MRYRARRAGLDLSVRELLGQLAAIGETVLIYPSTGGRPKARRMTTELHRTPAQPLPDLRPGTVGAHELGHTPKQALAHH